MNDSAIDLSTLRPGQNDPYLNKLIRVLIIHDSSYIVYLDNELNVQWNVSNHLNTPELGRILNQVAILEAKSDFIKPGRWTLAIAKLLKARSQGFLDFFSDPSLLRIRCLLGESIARIFDGNDNEEAQAALNEAKKLISAKNAEYARNWYYQHATIFAGASVFLAIMLWLIRNILIQSIGQTAFELAFCSLFGAVGAFVFVARRGQIIELDAILGAKVHKLEADARLATGMVAAALVNLAIKSGFLFSSIPSATQLKFMVLMSILAGYSERFIPNIVNKLQATATSDEKKTKKDTRTE